MPSLRELAKRVHMDPGHLSRLMNGKRSPGLDLAQRCDEVLGSGTTLTDIVADAERRAASRSSALATPGDPLTVCVPVVMNGRTQLVPLDRRSFLKGVAGSARRPFAASLMGVPRKLYSARIRFSRKRR